MFNNILKIVYFLEVIIASICRHTHVVYSRPRDALNCEETGVRKTWG